MNPTTVQPNHATAQATPCADLETCLTDLLREVDADLVAAVPAVVQALGPVLSDLFAPATFAGPADQVERDVSLWLAALRGKLLVHLVAQQVDLQRLRALVASMPTPGGQ